MANVVKKHSISHELAQKMVNEAVAKATHQTAPTQFVEANGIRFAYRRFGKAGGVPIVFNQHYTGTMDYWDPAVTNGLARDREVILFNNAGVSSSSGEVPIGRLCARTWPSRNLDVWARHYKVAAHPLRKLRDS